MGQCSKCENWFMTPDVLAVHHCYIQINPKPEEIEAPEWVDSNPKPVPTPKEQPVIEVTAAEESKPEPEVNLTEGDLYLQSNP